MALLLDWQKDIRHLPRSKFTQIWGECEDTKDLENYNLLGWIVNKNINDTDIEAEVKKLQVMIMHVVSILIGLVRITYFVSYYLLIHK